MRTNRKGSRRTINEFCYQRRKICMKKSWPHPAEATLAEREPMTGGLPHVRLERVPVLERAASAGALSPESFRAFVTEEGWRCDEGRSREPASTTPPPLVSAGGGPGAGENLGRPRGAVPQLAAEGRRVRERRRGPGSREAAAEGGRRAEGDPFGRGSTAPAGAGGPRRRRERRRRGAADRGQGRRSWPGRRRRQCRRARR
ncbi:uncharacterized protein LOC144741526 [Lampetra planeri]